MALPAITTVNTTIQTPPAPSKLQQTGAFLSQGATSTSPNTLTLLTQLSDLTPHLNGALSLSGIVQTGGTATATAASAHGLPIGDPIEITIAGATPAAYNGTFLCTPTTTTAFTYSVPSGTTSPATGTMKYTLEDVAELLAMATTFFAQGSNVPVYVLELGPDSVVGGVATLTAYLIANPQKIYAVLTPRTWDASSSLLTLIQSYESPSSMFYFFVTTTLTTYSVYTSLMKDVSALIEAPAYGTWSANALTAITYSGGGAPAPFSGVVTATTTTAHGVAVGQWFQISGVTPVGYNGWFQAQSGTTGSTLVYYVLSALGVESVLGTLVASYYSSTGITSTEFSQAAQFYQWLANDPAGGRVPPMQWRFAFGVTPFPQQGNSALFVTLNTANISVIGTGYQGGISTATIIWGKFLDGNQCNYWYSADWIQINVQLNMNNAVINGSNTTINPLLLNQDGINSLQAVGFTTMATGVSAGLGLGTPVQTELTPPQLAVAISNGSFNNQLVLNAVPFGTYYTSNPGFYPQGIYKGFSLIWVPQVGFEAITVNLTISGFATA